MKLIPLTQGKFAMVDDADHEWLSEFKWCARGKRGNLYAARGTRSRILGTQRTIFMHQILCETEIGQQVDHIDGNTLNNQRSNLRACSHAENIRNSKNRTTNRSGFKGVSLIKQRGKYAAHIKCNYKSKYLGYFHDPAEAAVAYNNAARQLFGEFARLNPV